MWSRRVACGMTTIDSVAPMFRFIVIDFAIHQLFDVTFRFASLRTVIDC